MKFLNVIRDMRPVQKGEPFAAGRAEAAYLAFTGEQGRAPSVDNLSIARVGDGPAGSLWHVMDAHGSIYVFCRDGQPGPGEVLAVYPAAGADVLVSESAPKLAAVLRTIPAADAGAAILDWLTRDANPTGRPGYKIVKTGGDRRYTLGVVYPAGDVDAHGDTADEQTVEGAAWRFLAESRDVGVMHADGTGGAGVVVESYIYRGPAWDQDGQAIRPGDWLAGVVWDEPAWELIRSGDLVGFSLQGWARREDEGE